MKKISIEKTKQAVSAMWPPIIGEPFSGHKHAWLLHPANLDAQHPSQSVGEEASRPRLWNSII